MVVLVTHMEIPEKCVNCLKCKRVSYMGMNMYHCDLSRLTIEIFDANESVRWTKISAICAESKVDR